MLYMNCSSDSAILFNKYATYVGRYYEWIKIKYLKK